MAIQQDQFQATPYTSTVPLVQVPPQAIEQQSRPTAPLQGQFGGQKGTGGLLIGDALLKGFMAGHQQKEQRNQAKAQATINAADAASEGAYRAYQDALTKAGGKQDDPAAQAAYQSYVATFQAGKQAKAQYVIPDKTQKGKKAAGDTDPVKSPDDKKKKNPVSAGFNNIGEFFAANPHIVPQIALLTMQPKPQGLSTEGQQQVQNLESGRINNQEAQLRLQNDQQKAQDQKTYSEGNSVYGQLTPDQIQQGMKDPKWADGYKAYEAAKTRLTPMTSRGPQHLYEVPVEGGGKIQRYMTQDEADTIPGAKVYSKPTTETQANLYYDAAARAWGTTRDKLTVPQLEYVDAMKARSQAQARGMGTYSYSTTDANGNHTTITRKVSDGVRPPTGLSSLPEGTFSEGQGDESSPRGQGGKSFGPPPQSGRGGMPTPPTTRRTAVQVTRELAAENTKNSKMDAAQKEFHTAITSKKDANGNPVDPIEAAKELVTEKNNAERDYRNARQVGGLGVGTTYGYFVDPKTGKQWQRTFPDEQSVSRVQQWASDNNRQFETLSNNEINQALGVQEKQQFGPPPQPSSKQAGGTQQKTSPTQQQAAETQEQGAEQPVGTPPPPKSLSQLRAEMKVKKGRDALYHYSGAKGTVEGVREYYGAIGKGISNVVDFDKKVISGVGHALDTYLHGDPGEVNDYEVDGSQVKTTAKEAQEFRDSGMAVREKYNVNGHDVYLTPEEANKAKLGGYKVTSSKKQHGDKPA
jgi:hypothetical protein